jgi:hypothetical protein
LTGGATAAKRDLDTAPAWEHNGVEIAAGVGAVKSWLAVLAARDEEEEVMFRGLMSGPNNLFDSTSEPSGEGPRST